MTDDEIMASPQARAVVIRAIRLTETWPKKRPGLRCEIDLKNAVKDLAAAGPRVLDWLP